MEDDKINKMIDDRIKKLVPEILKGSGFTDRKLTDTPTDANAVVPRGYVTMNGVTSKRPTSSVFGQFYFDNTLNKPIWYSSVSGAFVDATGTIV